MTVYYLYLWIRRQFFESIVTTSGNYGKYGKYGNYGINRNIPIPPIILILPIIPIIPILPINLAVDLGYHIYYIYSLYYPLEAGK